MQNLEPLLKRNIIMNMKSIHNIIAILFVGIIFIGCGDQSVKKNGQTPERKATRVASSEVESQEEGHDKEQIAVAKKLIASTDTDAVKAVDAKKMFKNYCAICHGRKGNMKINGSKDLSKSKTSLEQRVAQIYFGKGTMTPFKGTIKNEEIIAVAKYIDELKK